MMALGFCPNSGITHFTNAFGWRRRPKIRALKEWREYEAAVKDKDLSRALRFLREDKDNWTFGLERDWQVLDTCLNADDMRLVGSAYAFLKDKALLPNFGKYNPIVLEGPRNVTPTFLKSSTGLDVTKLSPKKWGLSGTSSFLLVTLFAGVSFLLNQGIDIRPNIAAVLGLAMLDAILLGGSCLAQISSFWPPYKRRICVHEAGHLLVAYLMGCPIRGVILDPIVAMQMGIQGQAGTQFWDEKLQNELAEGQLSGTAWFYLLGLQLKLLYMERLKVEKMMRISSGASVFF
ncbi:unnamed protein product [Withania somnifera]